MLKLRPNTVSGLRIRIVNSVYIDAKLRNETGKIVNFDRNNDHQFSVILDTPVQWKAGTTKTLRLKRSMFNIINEAKN